MFANTGQTVHLCKQSELSGENSVATRGQQLLLSFYRNALASAPVRRCESDCERSTPPLSPPPTPRMPLTWAAPDQSKPHPHPELRRPLELLWEASRVFAQVDPHVAEQT